jgi:hypothetical protein
MRINRRKRSTTRIRMQLLLLGLTGTEPAFTAWSAWLTRAGVAFDAVALKDLTTPTEFVDETGGALYQGMILSDAGLIEMALEPGAREALERLECDLGLRRLTAYAYPGPEYGLTSAHWSGELDDVEALLTDAGREVFPYLKRQLPVDPGSWAYLARPESPKSFETLVAAPDGAALVGIHRHADGREEMVQLFDANGNQAQGQILRRGQLNWLTAGTHLGYEGNYLSVQVDDVLLANHSWSVNGHRSDQRPQARMRMTAADAERAARWVGSRGLRLDLACNGAGSRDAPGAEDGDDSLLRALLEHRDAFGWINHTFEHRNLDDLSQAEIEAEIEENFRWAAQVGIDFERQALVTGAHTGLANLAEDPPRAENAHLRGALLAQGIHYVGCDASRPYPAHTGSALSPPGTPFAIGTALAVPRHPTALPHDAATPSQVLDRLRSAGQQGVMTFDQVVQNEARRVFTAVVSNDPRPHYFHQSNLIAGDDEDASGLVYTLLDAVLDRCRSHLADDVQVQQPTLAEIGRLLLRLHAWQIVLAFGSVRAYLEGDRVTLINDSPSALEVPLTGALAVGEGDSDCDWVRVEPGETSLERRPYSPELT